MIEKDKEWEDYLLSIGVTNLNDQSEIDRKLEEVEKADPFYKASILEALREIELGESTPITDIRAWLESLGN